MIHWLEINPDVVIVLIGLLGSALGYCAKSLSGRNQSTKLQEEALKILLRRELKTMSNYCVDKGHCNDAEMKEFLDTYYVYEHLYGNNGYATTLYETMEELYKGAK